MAAPVGPKKFIVPSMSRPRNCQDNAHMESFFARSRPNSRIRGPLPATPHSTPRLPPTSSASTTKNAFIPAWDTILRSSSNAWHMPSKVSTKSDEDHGPEAPYYLQLSCGPAAQHNVMRLK